MIEFDGPAAFQLLAQASQPGAPASGGQIPQQYLLFGMLLFFGVFYFMMFRSRNREQQKFQRLLGALKRNDRVMTVGGIYGTVVDVRDGEVVLKVDETSNVKIRFSKSAIKEVLREAAETK